MAKKKRGRPRKKGLQKCPKCGKLGWPFQRKQKRVSGVYLQNYFKHYVPEGYREHGVSAAMSRECYISSEGKIA